MKIEVLVIDDDLFLAKAIKTFLTQNGFQASSAHCAEDAWVKINQKLPGLIILDLSLPDEDGTDLCRKIRAVSAVPIIMLTSRSSSFEKVIGLEIGADDYLTKPFEQHELLARIKAILRRTNTTQSTPSRDGLMIGEIRIELDSRTVYSRDIQITVTVTEFKLLKHMLQNSGRALDRDALFESVWGFEIDSNSNSLDVLIYRLRTKLESTGAKNIIHTMRGYGYICENRA